MGSDIRRVSLSFCPRFVFDPVEVFCCDLPSLMGRQLIALHSGLRDPECPVRQISAVSASRTCPSTGDTKLNRWR